MTADIGGHVLCAWRAVVVDDHQVAEHFLDGVLATNRAAASEGGLGEQGAEAGEVAGVDEFGVARDEVLDGPVAGQRVGRGGAYPW